MSEVTRVLHVIGLMDRGGAETMIMNFYRNIDRSKVQFDFVENRDVEGAYDPEIRSLGGRIFRCPHYNGKNHFSYIRWWKTFFREHATEFQAVHGHLGSTAAIYLSIAKKHGLFTIAHSHNTSHISIRDLIYMAYSYPTRFIADFFFGCSYQAGSDRYGKRVVSSPQYKTLPNAIDTPNFSFNISARKLVRSELGVENHLLIGHTGRFAPQKNHTFLIDIFSEVYKRKPDSALLLIGTGELEAEIRQKVNNLGLSDAVHFLGSQKNVAQYLQAMDVFVMPSLYEGFGIAGLEAQCAGLPCFFSDSFPSDIQVTDAVSFLPLSLPASEWAERILSTDLTNRASGHEAVRNAGFDIKATADYLQLFYLNHW